MRFVKNSTVLAFDDREKPDYKAATDAGVVALEAQISAVDSLCRWDITDVTEVKAYIPIREQRQKLISFKNLLHDLTVALA